MAAKTDNHNLPAKLALRRQLLNERGSSAAFSVCDCFAGGETIWTILRREFPVADYLALDLKPKRNRLKLDSLRYLQSQEWEHDVIDLDAYGSPWRHYFEVLRRRRPCIVFLTIGNTGFSIQQNEGLAQLGLTFPIPGGLHAPIAGLVANHSLAAFHRHNFRLLSAWEALNPGGHARYIGLRLAPNV